MSFGEGRVYEFRVHESETAGITPEQAQGWLDEEYDRADCDPANPVGKILVSDKLLCVAGAAGPVPFAGRTEWAKAYALNAAIAVGRASVTVNVADATVGF